MSETETDILVPPGEYAITGLDRLLVVQGAAVLRRPSAPTALSSLSARPADTPGPSDEGRLRSGVEPAGAAKSPLVAILLAIVGLLAGTWIPSALPDKPSPTPTPPVPPAPAPVEPAKPKRPDWLPALERLNDRMDQLERSGSKASTGAEPAATGTPAEPIAAASVQPAPAPIPAPTPAPVPVPAVTAGPVYYLPAGTPCPPGYVCVP